MKLKGRKMLKITRKLNKFKITSNLVLTLIFQIFTKYNNANVHQIKLENIGLNFIDGNRYYFYQNSRTDVYLSFGTYYFLNDTTIVLKSEKKFTPEILANNMDKYVHEKIIYYIKFENRVAIKRADKLLITIENCQDCVPYLDVSSKEDFLIQILLPNNLSDILLTNRDMLKNKFCNHRNLFSIHSGIVQQVIKIDNIYHIRVQHFETMVEYNNLQNVFVREGDIIQTGQRIAKKTKNTSMKFHLMTRKKHFSSQFFH